MNDVAQPQPSLAYWILTGLGWPTLMLLFFATATSVILALALLIRGRTEIASYALLFVVPLPLLVGLFEMFNVVVSFCRVFGGSVTAPKTSAIVDGLEIAALQVLAGAVLTIPGFLMAMIGLVVRAHRPPRG